MANSVFLFPYQSVVLPGDLQANRFLAGNGTNVLPSLAFASEPTLGLYREGAADAHFVGGAWSIIRNALGAVSTDGLVLANLTAATTGSRIQYSPRLKLLANGWDLDNSISRVVGALLEVQPGPRNTVEAVIALSYIDPTGAIVPFIHNFQHPTGNTAIPDGWNTNVGINAGNFTMGSGATATYHSSYNSNIGVNAGRNITTGYYNSNVGANAGFGITTGYSNSNVGVNAGRNITTGYYNSNVGVNAGRYLADGSSLNQTGTNGVFLGYDTRAAADGDTNEIVIGASAIGLGSNTIVLGNTSIIKTRLMYPYVTSVAFTSLPTGVTGMLAWITDSNTNIWGDTVAGGGPNGVLAVYNGSNWTVVGK